MKKIRKLKKKKTHDLVKLRIWENLNVVISPSVHLCCTFAGIASDKFFCIIRGVMLQNRQRSIFLGNLVSPLKPDGAMWSRLFSKTESLFGCRIS